MDISRVRKKLREGQEPQKTEDIKTRPAEIEAPSVPTVPEPPQLRAPAPQEKEIEILAFRVGDEEFGLRITEVQEILRAQRITRVPRAVGYLRGITSLRGKVLPVIDLGLRLGLRGEDAVTQKIIVISSRSEMRSTEEPVGVLVSSVMDVIRLPQVELLEPPSTLSEEQRSFIHGVVRIKNRFISVLNVDEILRREESWG